MLYVFRSGSQKVINHDDYNKIGDHKPKNPLQWNPVVNNSQQISAELTENKDIKTNISDDTKIPIIE